LNFFLFSGKRVTRLPSLPNTFGPDDEGRDDVPLRE
jgi:hypothetical protein